MPIYEYECTRCHHRFEKLQRLSDLPVEECPACGGVVSQMLSAPAIQFKGSGFYVNDYAHKAAGSKPAGEKAGSNTGGEKSGEKSSDNNSSSTEKSESKAESKADSKPEAKPSTTETKST